MFAEQEIRWWGPSPAGHGLADAWLEQIFDFLASVPFPRAPRRALLHTEVMRQHLLVDPGGWRLTGIFDFEPAMIGHRAYDFVGAELLAYALLHVYSNLSWYLRELGAPSDARLTASPTTGSAGTDSAPAPPAHSPLAEKCW